MLLTKILSLSYLRESWLVELNTFAVCEELDRLLIHRELKAHFVDELRHELSRHAREVGQVKIFVDEAHVHLDHTR